MTSINNSDALRDIITSITELSTHAREAKAHALSHVDVNKVFKELDEIYQEFYDKAVDEKAILDPKVVQTWSDGTRLVMVNKTHEFKENFLGAYTLIKHDLTPEQVLSSRIWERKINEKCKGIIEATTKGGNRPLPAVPQNSNANVPEPAKKAKPPVPNRPKVFQNSNAPEQVKQNKPPIPEKPKAFQNSNANVSGQPQNKPPIPKKPQVSNANENVNRPKPPEKKG